MFYHHDKESHQKRRVTRSQYNRSRAFVNLQSTFDETIVVDTATKTLVHLIDVNNDDDADGDGGDNLYQPPDSHKIPTSATIRVAPICDIVVYHETNSVVAARPSLRLSFNPSTPSYFNHFEHNKIQ